MRVDPVGECYYKPLRRADASLDWMFWVVAALSILVFAVDQKSHPVVTDIIQISFIIGVLVYFAVGILVRLYWAPRAEDKRREELLSNAFAVNLTHERTEGYYNNDVATSVKRLAVILLENSFFSKKIASQMVTIERVKVGAYFLVWLIAALNRSSNLALVGVIAQVVFSEGLISRLFRLEWLRMRFERVYDELYNLIQATDDFETDIFRARAIFFFGLYETGKAYGAVVLSSRIFFQLNASLSDEWKRIKIAAKL